MEAAQNTFVSSTNWTDAVGPAAAIACINKYVKNDVHKHLAEIGDFVKKGWQRLSIKYELEITVSGLPSLCSFQFEHEEARAMNTYFTIEMLQYGILGFRQFKPSFAHDKNHVDQYLHSVEEVFKNLSKTNPGDLIETSLHHTGFSRLTKE